jgi:hypothetical protein
MSVKARTNLFLDIAIFLACLLAMSPRVTGIAVHEWLSLSFAAAIVAHLLFHWEWIVGVAPSFFKKLFHESRLNFAVDLVFFVSIALIMTSGIIISKVAAPALGLSFAFSPVWKGVHKVSADVALLALGVHCAMHWKWIVQNFMKWVAGPVMGLSGKRAAAKAPEGGRK